MSEALWSLKWEKGELVLLDQTNCQEIFPISTAEKAGKWERPFPACLSAVLRPSGWRRLTAWYWPLRKSKKKGSQALL